MKYTARDFALCMEKVIWRGVSFSSSGSRFFQYYQHSNKICKKLAQEWDIPWEKVMDEYPIQNWREPPQDLWERVAHPMLLINDMMSA